MIDIGLRPVLPKQNNLKNDQSWIIYSTRTIVLLVSTVITGCATTLMTEKVFIGDSVTLEFQRVYADLPNAMVYWYESPGFNEAALTFNPPLADCQEVTFYINPQKKKEESLGSDARNVDLIILDTEADEMKLWSMIPTTDNCAVLLTVGTLKDIEFTGLSASTRAGPFKRVNLNFPKPEPPDASAWPGLVVAPIFDVMFSAMYVVYYPVTRPMCPTVPDSVKVAFHLPNEIHKETVIPKHRAETLYKVSSIFPRCGKSLNCPQGSCVGYWLTAAMLDLRMEFRRDRNKLSIEGCQGPWKSRINNGAYQSTIIDEVESNTDQIDLMCEDTSSENAE